jgi:beta-glucosidase
MKDIKTLLAELTVEEKAALVEGYENWMTNPIPSQEIPSIYLTDGPLGIRKISKIQVHGAVGLGETEKSSAFPSLTNLSNTWDEDLAEREGEGLGKEAHLHEVDVLLAPPMNIKRDPRCGRNFEYISEDPLVAGKIASAYVKGIQKEGTSACLKHFALNNLEGRRFTSDSVADERAMREIYLKPFEIAVKESKSDTVMASYNKINGTFASEDKWLLTEVLRKDWGFDGLVMTDWGATNERVEGIKAGLDLDMPGGILYNRRSIIEAVKNGTLKIEDLDKAVANVLKLINKHIGKKVEIDEAKTIEEDKNIALEIAEKSAVLLKNDGALPLSKEGKYAVVGYLFDHMRYQGAGSSGINPISLLTTKEAFDQAGIKYSFFKGYEEKASSKKEELAQEALNGITDFDTVIFFAGLTAFAESEGYDRKDIKIPSNQLELIEKIAATGKKVIVILFNGSPIEVPFYEKANSILDVYLPGEQGGKAIEELVFGEKSPEGHLTETWPLKTEGIYRYEDFGDNDEELYKENIFVGYRYFDLKPENVRFPFGFGLSYSSFNCSNCKVEKDGEKIAVSLKVKNQGPYDSAEVVQVYVGANPSSKVFKANKELKAFKKVYLKAGEEKSVELSIAENDLAYYNTAEHRWVVENGTYPIYIATDVKTIIFKQDIEITGQKEAIAPYADEVVKAYQSIASNEITDEIFFKTLNGFKPVYKPHKPYTINTCIKDFKYSLWGRVVYKTIAGGTKKMGKNIKKMEEGEAKDAAIRNMALIEGLTPSFSPRNMVQSGGGRAQISMAYGLVAAANGHLIKAIKLMKQKEDPLPLPCEEKADKQKI